MREKKITIRNIFTTIHSIVSSDLSLANYRALIGKIFLVGSISPSLIGRQPVHVIILWNTIKMRQACLYKKENKNKKKEKACIHFVRS